jgi:nitroreductase
MDYQQFKHIITTRRSIRKFTEQPVTINDIREIIDCARYAPSDTNSQTWEFVAIVNRDIIKQIETITWAKLHEKAEQAEANGLRKEAKLLLKSFGPYATAFSDAPALIICLATPYESKFREKIFEPMQFVTEDVWEEEGIKSSSLAIQNLMLAAHCMGLATCPMTGPVLLAEDDIKKLIEIDDTRRVNMVIALGYPQMLPQPTHRKEVDQILRIIE